jgi:hypothetical protein
MVANLVMALLYDSLKPSLCETTLNCRPRVDRKALQCERVCTHMLIVCCRQRCAGVSDSTVVGNGKTNNRCDGKEKDSPAPTPVIYAKATACHNWGFVVQSERVTRHAALVRVGNGCWRLFTEHQSRRRRKSRPASLWRSEWILAARGWYSHFSRPIRTRASVRLFLRLKTAQITEYHVLRSKGSTPIDFRKSRCNASHFMRLSRTVLVSIRRGR